ncbi:hypothetical protein [Streptomyces sp. BK79]|uniref:hypothetical protein n=1 Tax=Streptomyces sp. BK79 TaxID=3350097 RepID=UPI0037707071
MSGKRQDQSPCPEPSAEPVAFLDGQQITNTQCGQCGTEIAGVNGRYACGVCGWTNHWSEGNRPLPTAADDVQT